MVVISLTAGCVRKFPLLLRGAIVRLDGIQSVGPVMPGDVRRNVDRMVGLLKESFLSTTRISSTILLVLMAAFTLRFASAAVRISVDMAE